MNVVIIGTGYVGLTTGAALAFLGHKVTCIDIDQEKVDQLSRGECPIYEPELENILKSSRDRLSFTTQYAPAVSEAKAIFIAVGTPSMSDGQPDLSFLKSAAHAVGQHLGKEMTVIVNKSTVPIGSGNWVESIVRDAMRDAKKESKFCVVSNPEFLREGSALSDMLYPDRIVVGSEDPSATQVMEELYRPLLFQDFKAPPGLPRPNGFTKSPFVATDLQSAELIKYAANAFLALKISFINEVAELAERVGANAGHIARGIGLDARIGERFLQAGIGWGGSCFAKDTSALISTAREYGLPMSITQAARDVNSRQRARVIEILLSELRILKGKKIGILGLAFKPFTDDLRDAPALEIAVRLKERGAKVVGFDPVANARVRKEWAERGPILVDSVEEVFAEADAVVLVTEWPELVNADWRTLVPSMRNRLVVDGRSALERNQVVSSGARLITMGFGG
jgi:UDPglucose 6-dehydrogenase